MCGYGRCQGPSEWVWRGLQPHMFGASSLLHQGLGHFDARAVEHVQLLYKRLLLVRVCVFRLTTTGPSRSCG